MAFNIYDIDKNGKIDRKEMEKIIEAIYELRGQANTQDENLPAAIVSKIMEKLGEYNRCDIQIINFLIN